MTRRNSSLGLFGIFGRSPDLRRLDDALRAVDLHPRLVPEAVKLTTVSLLKEHADGGEPAQAAYRGAAELLAYCMIGAEGFAGANDSGVARQVEARIELALQGGAPLDAQLILLTIHAKIVQPSVIAAFGLESSER